MSNLAHYVAGEWVAPRDEQWSADVNPSDATQILAQVPYGQIAVIERAVEAAQAAFRAWRVTTGADKAELLHKAANLLAQRRQEIGTVIALEVGKPIGEALPEV